MSLARTALRLAVVEALRVDPVIAALVGARIFDSRITALDFQERKPVITVYTEDDNARSFSENNGGEPFDRTVDLVIEIAMTATDDENGEPVIYSPATDRELEAVLDLLEHRATDAVTVGEGPSGRLVRLVTRRVSVARSSRYPTDETGEKLAIRVITYSASLKGEDRDATAPATGRYATLPDPLRSVCEAMPEHSSGELVCRLIAAAIPPEALIPFEGANLKMWRRKA